MAIHESLLAANSQRPWYHTVDGGPGNWFYTLLMGVLWFGAPRPHPHTRRAHSTSCSHPSHRGIWEGRRGGRR
jgi:hypothetical protein